MLVLTHTTGSVIHIGDDITLKVLSIGQNRIKIGYFAPERVNILRDEVKQRQSKYIECSKCLGAGIDTNQYQCSKCNGTGRVREGTQVKCDGNHAGPPCTDPECWAKE